MHGHAIYLPLSTASQLLCTLATTYTIRFVLVCVCVCVCPTTDIGDIEREMPGMLEATVNWFTIYKIPTGKPPNKFAFNKQAKNRVSMYVCMQVFVVCLCVNVRRYACKCM